MYASKNFEFYSLNNDGPGKKDYETFSQKFNKLYSGYFLNQKNMTITNVYTENYRIKEFFLLLMWQTTHCTNEQSMWYSILLGLGLCTPRSRPSCTLELFFGVKSWSSIFHCLNDFYFCGRKPEGDFPYCKLHVLYAFQPKNPKEELIGKDDDVPAFIEKKVKASK